MANAAGGDDRVTQNLGRPVSPPASLLSCGEAEVDHDIGQDDEFAVEPSFDDTER